MAMQGSNGYQGISSMLIERMSEIRDTYQKARKKRLQGENNDALNSASGIYKSYKSGQSKYHK